MPIPELPSDGLQRKIATLRAELQTQRNQLLTELRERVEAEHTAYVVMYQGAAAHGLTRAIAIIDEFTEGSDG